MNYKKKNVKFIIILQHFFKNRLSIINKFKIEHIFLSNIIENSSIKSISILFNI